jgi:acyl carrier protein
MITSERIRTFIESNFYVPEDRPLADDSSLLESGIVDSTGVLEITAFLEAEYCIKVADAEIVPENMDSIAAITMFTMRKCAKAA